MIIEKIVIRSFGLIRDMTLEFSEGVNVIEGRNEVGKSTIAAFIKYMLYGFPEDDSDAAVTERNRRLNWETGVAEGSMYVRVKGKRYLVTRMTSLGDGSIRRTYKEESTIIDLDTGAPAFGKVPAGEVFFGVPRELFENTAFVGQIGDPRINEGSVKESIENILFSGAETVNNRRACTKISGKMELLLREGGKGGTIVDLMRKSEELEEKLRSSDEENKLILEKEAELHEIRSRKTALEDRLKKLRDLDSDYNNVMIIQTFDKLHELEEECDKQNEIYRDFIEANTRKGFVPSQDYLTDIAVARRGVNDAYSTLLEANELYNKERSAIGITREAEGAIELSDECGGEGAVKALATKNHRTSIRDIALMIVGGLFGVAAALLFMLAGGDVLYIAGGALAAVLAASALGFGIWSFLKAKQNIAEIMKKFSTATYRDLLLKLEHLSEQRNKRDAMIKSTEGARRAAENAKMAYDNAKLELLTVILKWNDETPREGLNEFLDELEARVKAFLAEKDRLHSDKTEIELTVAEVRRTLADKNEIDVRARVVPIRRKALVGINHEDIITDIARHKTEIAEEEVRFAEVERLLFTLKSRTGDPGELYSKIQALDTRIEELRRRHKAYYIALKAIESASDNLRREISPRLGEYATEMMGIMTDKKYTSFDVSDGLTVDFLTDDGERRSVDFLSGGTRDLAYIAVRLALVDMLYTEKPPIVFDESFAHQDNVRARAAMKAIVSLSGEGSQSFIFTCRNRESALAAELTKGAGVFKLAGGVDSLI